MITQRRTQGRVILGALTVIAMSAAIMTTVPSHATQEPPSNTGQVSAPTTLDARKAKERGALRIPKTTPAITVNLRHVATGTTITFGTHKASVKRLPAGIYQIAAQTPGGYRLNINGNKDTLAIRAKRTTSLRVALTRLAGIRFESATTDGLTTSVEVRGRTPGKVEIQFLDEVGLTIHAQTVTVPRGNARVRYSAPVAAVQVRARPVMLRGRFPWTATVPQRSLLATSEPDVTLSQGSISLSAPVSGTIASVTRVNLITGAATTVNPLVEAGRLSLSEQLSPGAYQYQLTGQDAAGAPQVTTIAVSTPDSKGNGLAVLAPNTQLLTVTTIEFPRDRATPAAIPLTALPAGTGVADLIGNPVIASTPNGQSTVVGRVLAVRAERLLVSQESPFWVFQEVSQEGFSEGLTTRFLGPRTARSALKCEMSGVEVTGPAVDLSLGTPTTDGSRWALFPDGADLHLRGNFQASASISLTGLTVGGGLECYLDDLPMAAVVNINIPTPIGPIPTVLTAKPFLEAEAKVEVDLGVVSRELNLSSEFEISNGLNGPKLHTPHPFDVSVQPRVGQALSPRGTLRARAGMDFAYGLGQGTTGAGLQVSGLSLKAGPEIGLVFQSGLAAGRPDSAACVSGRLDLANASIEGHILEVWAAGKNWSFVDATFYDLPWGIPAFDEPINCWGAAPPIQDDAVEGDFDADGIRDELAYRRFTSNDGSERARLSVTASSTGKTSSIDIGSSDYITWLDDAISSEPIDGRPGVEAVIRGVLGANAQFTYFVTWQGGKLGFVPPPGQAGDQWNSLYKFWGLDYHVRRVQQGIVIVSNIQAQLRYSPSDRSDEVLTITQYEWTQDGWRTVDTETFRFRYPRTVKGDFDLTPYGESIA